MANLTLKLTGDYLYPPEIIEAEVAMMDRVNLDITLLNDSREFDLSDYKVYIGCTDARGTVLFDANVESAAAGKVSATIQPRIPGQLSLRATLVNEEGDGDYTIKLGVLTVASEDRRGMVASVISLTSRLLDALRDSLIATTNAVTATQEAQEATAQTNEAIAKAEAAAGSVESALERDNAVYDSMVAATAEAVTATENANEATSRANSASVTAENATITAQQVTEQAQQAADMASEAAATIGASVQQAQDAVTQANTAVTRAEQAIAGVEDASRAAEAASQSAAEAEQRAQSAASLAESTIAQAQQATEDARNATTLANESAETADAATANAITATANANTAAATANTAADRVPLTIKIQGAATAPAATFDGTKNLTLNVTSLDASALTGTATINTTGHAASATTAVSALSATEAEQDGLGRVIADTYVTQSEAEDTYLTQTVAATEYATKAEDAEKLPLSGGVVNGTVALKVASTSDTTELMFFDPEENHLAGIKYHFKDNAYGFNGLQIGATYNGGSYWTNGPKIYLRPDGAVRLEARDSSNSKLLILAPNGGITWDGKTVECASEKGANYLKLSDGTQFCWGNIAIDAQQTTGTVNFPRAFKSGLRVMFGRTWAASPNEVLYMRSASNSNFTWTCVSPTSNSHGYDWFAIGIGAD